jgi:beta-lactamase regulating signal transducer with metallopeptidase domain
MNLELDSLPRLGLFLLQANLVWSVGFIATYFLIKQATPKARYSAQVALLAILPLSIMLALGLNHPTARTMTDPLTMNLYSGTVLLEALDLSPSTNTAPSIHGMVRTGLWTLSVLGVFGVLLLGLGFWRRLSRLFQLAGDTHPEVQSQLDKVAGELGINRPISLFLSKFNISPFSYGFGKPRIVLPVELTENLTEEEIDLILRHELHHIRRMDFLTNVMQKTIRIAFFYNPFVHWLDRLIELDRELLCDQAVLESCSCTKRRYAELLIRVAEFVNQHPMLSPQVTFHSKQSHLRKRLNNMKTNYLSHTAPWRHALTTTALIASFAAISLTGYGADTTKKKTKVKKDKLTFEVGSDQLTIRRNGETHQFSKDSKEYKQLLEQYKRLIQQEEAPEGEILGDATSTAERPLENDWSPNRRRKMAETKHTVSETQAPRIVERKRRTESRNNPLRESRNQYSSRQLPFFPRVREEQLVRPNSAPKPPQSRERAYRRADINPFTVEQLPQSENRKARPLARSQSDRGRRSLSNGQADDLVVRQNKVRVQDEHIRALEQMQRELKEQQGRMERQHLQLEQQHHQLRQELERAEVHKQAANESRQKAMVAELRAKESEMKAEKQADRVEQLRQMLEDEGIISKKDSAVEIEFSKNGLKVNGESHPGELFEKAREIFEVDSKDDFKSNFRYRSIR